MSIVNALYSLPGDTAMFAPFPVASAPSWSLVDAAFADGGWGLEDAADTMAARGFRHLVVVEDGDVCGIISMRDIIDVWRPSAQR